MSTRWLFSVALAIVCLALAIAIVILAVLIVRDDRTTFFAGMLYWFTLCFALLALTALLPLSWIAWERRDSGPVVVTSVLASYALVAVFLGWFAYMFVPAVYTRDQR